MSQPSPSTSLRGTIVRWSLLVAIVGGASCALAVWVDQVRFLQSYLVAWLFWLGISLGCLALLLLHRLTGGLWGVAVVHGAQRGAALVPLLGLLFLPIAVNLPLIYSWARDDVTAHDELLEEKSPYLNPQAFLIRATGYFVVWTLLSVLMRGARRWRLPGNIGGVGLALYFLSGSFAAIDWGMSLEPHWYSTTYGVMFVVGQGVSGLAFAILARVTMSDQRPWPVALPRKALSDLNNLLLAFTMLWAYIAFTQFLIIWYGNMAEDSIWYVRRTQGGWQWIALTVVAGHFVVPFFGLLLGAGKQNPHALAGIAAILLVAHWLDIHWLVMPAFYPEELSFSWFDPVATVTLGSVWLAVWAFQQEHGEESLLAMEN